MLSEESYWKRSIEILKESGDKIESRCNERDIQIKSRGIKEKEWEGLSIHVREWEKKEDGGDREERGWMRERRERGWV